MSSHKCAFCNQVFPLIEGHTYRRQYLSFKSSGISEQYVAQRFASVKVPGGCLIEFFKCPNDNCAQTSIHFEGFDPNMISVSKWIHPDYKIKQLPVYVPSSIRQDFEESCKIVELSPKSSATLSRRVLQSMIRDFWEIEGKPNLHQEIEAIKDKINTDEFESLMSLKSIGNIGAHPHQDINYIVDVDANEAYQLIELIEMFIDDWYIQREQRKLRLQKVKDLGDSKQKYKTTVVTPEKPGPQ